MQIWTVRQLQRPVEPVQVSKRNEKQVYTCIGF